VGILVGANASSIEEVQHTSRLQKRAPVKSQSSRHRDQSYPRNETGRKRKASSSSSSSTVEEGVFVPEIDNISEIYEQDAAQREAVERELGLFKGHIFALELGAVKDPQSFKSRLAAIKAQLRAENGPPYTSWTKENRLGGWSQDRDRYHITASQAVQQSNWHFLESKKMGRDVNLYKDQIHELGRASNLYKYTALTSRNPRPSRDLRDYHLAMYTEAVQPFVAGSVVSRIEPVRRDWAASIHHAKYLFWDKEHRKRTQGGQN
jgi:hypothetical protein